MIVAGTGHRKIAIPEPALVDGASAQLRLLEPSLVITGMALGWDMALAEAADRLGVPYVAAVPFPSQADRWPDYDRRRYETILNRAEEVFLISEFMVSAAYETRNRWMIDRADKVLAFWDGSLNGGTANAVRYARKKHVPLVNAWGLIG